MSESRQPVPSPVLGIVGLVVAAGLITLALRYKSPQPATDPKADDVPASTEKPADPTGTAPQVPSPEPVVEQPPAAEVPQPLVPSPADLAGFDAQTLASSLASIPEAERGRVASAALLVAASRPGAPAGVIVPLKGAAADLNTTDDQGRTPLMLAAASANIDFVFALLDNGAAVWTKDAQGMDAREHALARNDAQGYEIAEVLEGAAPE